MLFFLSFILSCLHSSRRVGKSHAFRRAFTVCFFCFTSHISCLNLVLVIAKTLVILQKKSHCRPKLWFILNLFSKRSDIGSFVNKKGVSKSGRMWQLPAIIKKLWTRKQTNLESRVLSLFLMKTKECDISFIFLWFNLNNQKIWSWYIF